MNYYPEQLRRIADMCEALNTIDGSDSAKVVFKNRIPIHDADSSAEVYGYLVDEVGGAWSFEPVEKADQ